MKSWMKWALAALATVVPFAVALGCVGGATVETDRIGSRTMKVQGNPQVIVMHDDQRHVTCWAYYPQREGFGFQCLPDKSFQEQP